MRCEDYPCCGHGPAPLGDGGGCPDASGRFDCVLCGRKLARGASSSICASCSRRRARMSDEERDWRDEMQDRYDRGSVRLALLGLVLSVALGLQILTPGELRELQGDAPVACRPYDPSCTEHGAADWAAPRNPVERALLDRFGEGDLGMRELCKLRGADANGLPCEESPFPTEAAAIAAARKAVR